MFRGRAEAASKHREILRPEGSCERRQPCRKAHATRANDQPNSLYQPVRRERILAGVERGSGRIRGIFFRQRAPAPTSPLHAESSPATKSAVVHTFSPPPPPIQFLTRNRPRKRSGRSGRSRVAAGLVERRPARIVSAIKACKGRSIEDIPNPQVEKPRTRPAPTQNGVGGNAPQMDTRLLCPSMNLYCGPLTMYSCCPCSIE